MRIDIDFLPAFSAITGNTVVNTVDLSGMEYAAFGVIVTAVTGAPTRAAIAAVWSDSMAGTNLFTSGDTFGTIDFTAAGKYMVSRVGPIGAARTIILAEGFLLPPPLKYVALMTDFSGGTAPSMSGSIVVFKYTR